MGGWDGGTGCDEGAVKRQQMGGEQRPKRELEPGEDGRQSDRSSELQSHWTVAHRSSSYITGLSWAKPYNFVGWFRF